MFDFNEELFRIENLLNEYSGKRYHIKTPCETNGISLIEVERIGKEKFIQTCDTPEQLYCWIRRNISISISKGKTN